jgi:hypothetical protein
MHLKFLFLLSFTMTVAINVSSCASLHYAKTEDLQESCTDAAKKKWAHYSASCKLLKELSYKDYKAAVATGNAWIKAHELDYKEIQNIRRGVVWIGMPADAAKLAWGAPSTVNKARQFRHHEEWTYADGNTLSIQQGKVIKIHN